MFWIGILKKRRNSNFVLPLSHFDLISSSRDVWSWSEWSGVLTSACRDDMLCLATTDKEMEGPEGEGLNQGHTDPASVCLKAGEGETHRGCVWIISLFHTGKHWSAVKAKAKETRRQRRQRMRMFKSCQSVQKNKVVFMDMFFSLLLILG